MPPQPEFTYLPQQPGLTDLPPWNYYPIVLYLTPAAKPFLTENESHYLGALETRFEAITTIRALARELCAIQHWSMGFKEEENVLWCYMLGSKTPGDDKGGVKIKAEEDTQMKIKVEEGAQEAKKENVLMGWFAVERVWLRTGEVNAKKEMEDFVMMNMFG